jgi:histidinol phosphatase-like PHP family hydrolase
LKLKLDLHTHCLEATGMMQPSDDVVRRIVERARERGLDGLAVTEHWNRPYGVGVRDIARRLYGESILIIPGHEIGRGGREIVELFLDERLVFRFVAHPRDRHSFDGGFERIHGIEIQNGMHYYEIDRQRVRAEAEEHGLLLLENSDAHDLNDIGSYYNEIEWDELVRRAQGTAT